MDKHNIIVCSKHQDNPSKLTVTLDQDLICNENEYWTLNIASFNMIKSFYAVQNNLNNGINIWLMNKSTGMFDEPYFRSISEGNYSVRSLILELKRIFLDLIDVSYDGRLNKFLFKRFATVVDEGYESVDDYDVFIEPINSGIFLGIDNGAKFLVTSEGVHSTKFININGYTSMLLKISGGVSIDNSIMNITNPHFEANQVLAIIDLNQVAPMDSIIFSNQNDSNNFVYKVSNKKINNFTIEIVNESNVSFPQISDYILNLCFEKKSRQNDALDVIKYISTRLNDLIFYLLYVFDRMDLSQPKFT